MFAAFARRNGVLVIVLPLRSPLQIELELEIGSLLAPADSCCYPVLGHRMSGIAYVVSAE
jgi:hypothetical protein